MDIHRLGWAGLEITSGEHSLVVDLCTSFGSMEDHVGPPLESLPAPSRPASLALVTHLHRDHTDPDALAAALAPGARVLRPAPMEGELLETGALLEAEQGLQAHGLAQQVVEPWERVEDGPFAVTAVPAVDGFGDPQVSWVVEADGTRVLQAGDTMLHGAWWLIALRCGPIDVAFLPVNGAVASLPHRQPASPLAAVMGPEQAAVAAHALGARLAVPIHYGAIHHPPNYAQVDHPAESFAEAATRLGVSTTIVAPGDAVPLPVDGS